MDKTLAVLAMFVLTGIAFMGLHLTEKGREDLLNGEWLFSRVDIGIIIIACLFFIVKGIGSKR